MKYLLIKIFEVRSKIYKGLSGFLFISYFTQKIFNNNN